MKKDTRPGPQAKYSKHIAARPMPAGLEAPLPWRDFMAHDQAVIVEQHEIIDACAKSTIEDGQVLAKQRAALQAWLDWLNSADGGMPDAEMMGKAAALTREALK